MLLGNIQKAVDAEFPRIKLKAAPGWDYEMLSAARGAFPDTRFHIDCNGGYSLDDLDLFKKIDAFELEFIEQPLAFDDLLDHAELAKQISTPVCLDESIVGTRQVEQALRIGAAEYINIKPGRVGGLANSVRIHDICQDAGVPVWVGGMLESAVGAAFCIELATLPNFVVMAAADEAELVHMTYTAALYDDGPIAVRYPRGNGTGVAFGVALGDLQRGVRRAVIRDDDAPRVRRKLGAKEGGQRFDTTRQRVFFVEDGYHHVDRCHARPLPSARWRAPQRRGRRRRRSGRRAPCPELAPR